MTILGLHHITLGSSDAQHTIDFYTGVLGLRFIKRTVNYDDPTTYHLYFGNDTASPGSAITFFEWPGAARGRPGIGGTHHFALTVANRAALLKWKRYLHDLAIRVEGPFARTYFDSIYFRDPDNTLVEIATVGAGFAVDEPITALGQQYITPDSRLLAGNRDEAAIRAEMHAEPVPSITPDMALSEGMHHITAFSSNLETTAAFYEDLLGLTRVKMTANYEDPTSQHWYWAAEGKAEPGKLITYFGRDSRRERRAQMGAGQTHHFALAVADDAAQQHWRQKLLQAGLRVSPVMDRNYFHSIYTNDPDGHIVEIATMNPGFTSDESLAELGDSLKLPAWLEQNRSDIQAGLRPVQIPARGRKG
jgi:glyoxalase family protein